MGMATPALLLSCAVAFAQPGGEVGEASPEALDAAFTAEDAAREAAMFSDTILERSPSDPLAAARQAADLVVRARVIAESVHYDANDLPFTHTRFAVEELIAGESTANELVLVQEGGPSRTKPEMVYMVSESHYFNPGDEELLFLKLASEISATGSLRVDVQERFSVRDGRVYTESGRGLILSPRANGAGHRLSLSADRHPDPGFRQIRIGSHTFTRHYGGGGNQEDADGEDAPATSQRSSASPAPSYRDSADVESFIAAISN
ncbi:MAG: hypothetical protein R3E54_03485 [Halioglobus sp.]